MLSLIFILRALTAVRLCSFRLQGVLYLFCKCPIRSGSRQAQIPEESPASFLTAGFMKINSLLLGFADLTFPERINGCRKLQLKEKFSLHNFGLSSGQHCR